LEAKIKAVRREVSQLSELQRGAIKRKLEGTLDKLKPEE